MSINSRIGVAGMEKWHALNLVGKSLNSRIGVAGMEKWRALNWEGNWTECVLI